MEGNVLLAGAMTAGFVGTSTLGCAMYGSLAQAAAALRSLDGSGLGASKLKGAKAWFEGLARYYVRNGVSACWWAKGVLWKLRQEKTFNQAACLLNAHGVEADAVGVCQVAAFACVVLSALVLLVFHAVFAALLAPAVGLSVLSVVVVRGMEKNHAALLDQIPDALRCMEACLYAGLSLPQAFYEVSEEMREPVRSLFAKVSQDLDLGYSVDESLERFRRNADVAELNFVAVALDIQYACGGSAAPILRSAQDSVSRGLELKRSLRVQTAQAKFSAQIVTVMPLLLLGALSLISPGFIWAFFESAEGLAMLAIAVAMQVAGVLLVRRMLEVEI